MALLSEPNKCLLLRERSLTSVVTGLNVHYSNGVDVLNAVTTKHHQPIVGGSLTSCGSEFADPSVFDSDVLLLLTTYTDVTERRRDY